MKVRLILLVAAATAVLAIAGCGGGSGGSGTDPAAVAPPDSPFYVEFAVRPEGQMKADVESLAATIAGVDDLGGLVISELENSSDSEGSFDYAKEVEPWLGERAGISFESYDGDDFTGYGFAVQTSDADAAQAFVDKQAESGDEPARAGSYEGIDYEVDTDDGQTIGVVDDLVVLAEDEQVFKHLVDASGGDSLADAESFSSAIAAVPDGSFAEAFFDIGGLIEQTRGPIDPEAQKLFDSAGIDPTEATAVASLVPGSDQIEIDLSSDLSDESPSPGDASELLGSLPAGSLAALASAEFGKRFGKAIDGIDAEGIEGEITPHELKSTLKEAGIDLEKISGSIGDIGVFAEGSGEADLGGAVVLATKNAEEATNTVANIGFFLRAAGTPGITATTGKASGFSIRNADLGPRPLVVAAQGDRIAIAYGPAAAAEALGSGQTLADDPVYKEAVAALGDTPISGFVAGPAALRLASSMLSDSEQAQKFQQAEPYLSKIDYVALGSGTAADLATAKLIVGVSK